MKLFCVPDACPLILSSNCVYYTGIQLAYSGIAMNDSITVALGKLDAAIGNIVVGTQNLQQVTDNGSTTTHDIEITSSATGLILKSPNGTRWRIQILDTGELTATSL